MARILAACLAGLALASCGGDAADAPNVCHQIGTFHRSARDSLEQLRTHHMVSSAEWRCLADALAGLDATLTRRCESAAVTLGEIRREQRAAYAACFDPPRDAVLQKALVRSLPGR